MRAPLILMAMVALGLTTEAQETYAPMLQQGRTWCGVEGGWLPTPVSYAIESDTVLGDGSLWHLLNIQYEGSPTPGFAGWFHENSETGEVWMRWDLELDPGTLWFDFGMEPGDSMAAPNCVWNTITCLDVQPFTWTDGTVSRRLTIQLLPNNENFVEHWIEGLGSENGPMGPAAYLCIADWDPHAACLVENGQLRHDFELDTTWLPAHPGCADSMAVTGLPDLAPSDGQWQVRSGQLTWSGPAPLGSIHLYDLTGRLLTAFDGHLPIDAPLTGGILIAVMPDGSRHKIRIDP